MRKSERILQHCRVVGHRFCGPRPGGGLPDEGHFGHHPVGRRRGDGQRLPGHDALCREGARQTDRPAEQAGRDGRRRPHVGLQFARRRLHPALRGGEPLYLQGPGHQPDRLRCLLPGHADRPQRRGRRRQQRPALENPRRSVRRRQEEPRPGQDGIDGTGRPSPRGLLHDEGDQRRRPSTRSSSRAKAP